STGRTPHVDETRGEATPFPRRVFESDDHRTTPLATDCKPLNNPENCQQNRRGYPDGRCRWEQANRNGSSTHEHHRGDKHTLAAEFIAEVAEKDPAQRTGDIADRHDGERSEERRVGKNGTATRGRL